LYRILICAVAGPAEPGATALARLRSAGL